MEMGLSLSHSCVDPCTHPFPTPTMLSLVILSALSLSTVNWISHPVRGNETVLLSGSFASDTSTADAGTTAAVGTATIGAAAASLPSFSLRSAVTGAALRVPASHADAHAASFVLPLLGDQPGPGVSGSAGTDESEVYPAWELSLDGGGAGLWINTPEVSPLPTSGSVVRLPLVVVRLSLCLYVSVSSLCLCVSVCLRVPPCVSVCLRVPLCVSARLLSLLVVVAPPRTQCPRPPSPSHPLTRSPRSSTSSYASRSGGSRETSGNMRAQTVAPCGSSVDRSAPTEARLLPRSA